MEKEYIVKIRQNDEEAIKHMIDEYRNLIYSIISHFNLNCNDYRINLDDLFQEGVIALYEASKTYKLDGEASFTTYAYVVIRRRIIRVINNYFRIYAKEGVSFDNASFDWVDRNNFNEYCQKDPALVIEKEYQKERYLNFLSNLNEEERKIFLYRLNNISYKAIAEKLSISVKHVDYVISKLKKKYVSK